MISSEFSSFFFANLVFFLVLIFALFFLSLIVFSKNPINVILFLIAYFFDIAILFIFCGADYLAVLILLLYAGAISIILLFVVMLLDMKDLVLQKEKIAKTLWLFFFIFIFILLIKGFSIFYSEVSTFMPRVSYTNWYVLFWEKTNMEVIGIVLYEYYLFQFLVIGVFLFLIMVLIISLIINHNLLAKRQKLVEQLNKKNPITFKG